MKSPHEKALSSTEGINKARKQQGYKPKKFDRATKGMYDFLDKFPKAK